MDGPGPDDFPDNSGFGTAGFQGGAAGGGGGGGRGRGKFKVREDQVPDGVGDEESKNQGEGGEDGQGLDRPGAGGRQKIAPKNDRAEAEGQVSGTGLGVKQDDKKEKGKADLEPGQTLGKEGSAQGDKNQGDQVGGQPVGLAQGGKDTDLDVLDPPGSIHTEVLGKAPEGDGDGGDQTPKQSGADGFLVQITDGGPVEKSIADQGEQTAVEAGIIAHEGGAGIDGEKETR